MAELARTPATPPAAIRETESVSLWKEAWRRFRKNKIALVGAGIVLFLSLSPSWRRGWHRMIIKTNSWPSGCSRLLASIGSAPMILAATFFPA